MSRKHVPTVADLHRSWLELVDIEGPFLAVPPLKRVWENGIPQPDPNALATLKDAKPAFEKAWENWDANRDDVSLDLYRGERDTWVETVLRDVLGWDDSYVTELGSPEIRSPDHAVTVRATGAVSHGDMTGALVLVTDPVDSLRDPLDDGWASSPIDRMEELLRTAGVPIGVVTDGRWWAIVSVREKTIPTSGIVDAQDWIAQPEVRNAFIELLQRRRLFAGEPRDRLTELFGESVAAAEEITEALGTQVRRAVELLVQAMSEAALDAQRNGVPDPLPVKRAEVYEAAVTVMMRVVFLLFAEERGLLPQGRLFTMGYGISDELDALDKRARDEGTETLDATHLTWHRLLATSRALYNGASFEDLRLPSYGGSLFDPDRYPFLVKLIEQGQLAITVSDRVMLEVLRAVQVAQLKGQPARRISFRDIDVEQIGYIYEGLLGYSCETVEEIMVGLIGRPGEEPEMPLAILESLAAVKKSDAALADAILAWVKQNQPAAKPPTKAALAKAIRSIGEIEDAETAVLSVTKDESLRERLRPIIGVIRRDLRNRPFVVQPGGVLVIETPSRASAGAHYTPKSLAEEVVRYALEPLVFEPGPHQTANKDDWQPVSSDRIVDLKIADIACGSGAFLVSAARYLAARLVEAWQREGVAYGTPHELQTHAIRMVVASCLYGADINAMAVEMCKLSLWLVSLDAKLPFSFVDDKILHGNSLLGLTNEQQLKDMHIDPSSAGGQLSVLGVDVDDVLAKAARLRRQLATEVTDTDPQRSATTKRRQWRDYQNLVSDLTDIADGVVAAGLRWGGKPSKQRREAYENLRIALELAYPAGNGEPDRRMLEAILEIGLTPAVQTDYERWKPLHWIVAVPDVMERGGFDALIGNPPFLGDYKIADAMGVNLRSWLVEVVAFGCKGKSDLVGYFFLRAMSLLLKDGTLGLIGTNSISQNKTREVGLDQMVSRGFTIVRCIQSEPWPTSNASLEFAAVWGAKGAIPETVRRNCDGMDVARISTFLEPLGRADEVRCRLPDNKSIAFKGCEPYGGGFVISADVAQRWVEADPRNSDVVRPYLTGEDLNSHPDGLNSRWVIDFFDKSESEAQQYEAPYLHIVEHVKPYRERAAKAVRELPWWLFHRSRPTMRKAIVDRRLDMVIAITRVSKTLMPMRVPVDQVLSDSLTVFTTSSYAMQAILSSSIHQMWAIKYGSGLRTDPRYTGSTIFETFPLPGESADLSSIGRDLDRQRSEIMKRLRLGLTDLYNQVNNPEVPDRGDIAQLRALHVHLDELVAASYGWGDIQLNHDFHEYRKMTRWMMSREARAEIFDRLLEENQERAESQGDASSFMDDDDEGDDDE
ncbi:Eco57I restriction-modification methylase domain-containing protein [Streptosporangium amethystogenes]|uniref:Eco57I restriction-modification methylase domain-containing protein n=1 Tax=Streptosporangium amethystogenes TaxID=2002 RepID=UPI0037AA3773